MDSSFQNGLTALAGGGQAGATLISRSYSRFTVVASTGDSALLPSASPLLQYVIKNAAANSMNVYPNPIANAGVWNPAADQINAAGANVPFALAAGHMAIFVCMVNGFWDVILTA
jgi:hypothetical protein